MENEKSGKNTELTNRDIINFFADKSMGEGSATQEYLNGIYKSKGLKGLLSDGNYIDLARSFKFFRMLSGYGSAENMFKSCKWLKTLAEKCNLDVFLDGISQNKFYEETYKADFQRWHFIVSWCGLKCFEKTVIEKEIESEKAFLDCSAIDKDGVFREKGVGAVKCKELLYWLCEASAGKGKIENVLKETQKESSFGLESRLREEVINAVKKAKENNCIKQYI